MKTENLNLQKISINGNKLRLIGNTGKTKYKINIILNDQLVDQFLECFLKRELFFENQRLSREIMDNIENICCEYEDRQMMKDRVVISNDGFLKC